MGTTPTVIPSLTSIQFANRVAELFPRGWSSDDAKQSGNVYAVFLAAGQGMRAVLEEIQYAATAQRLQTETFPELDLASVDFLGGTLPRPAGMSDAAFAQLIIDNLFQTAATRSALQNALTNLTGSVPRMLEPWSIFDTGVWTRVSYWNVDTVANPGRWGNGGLRYQGFIETAAAPIPLIGPDNPILTWGTAYWNVPGYFFGIISANAEQNIFDVLNRLRAYGTIVWVKILSSIPAGTIVAPGAASLGSASAISANSVSLGFTAPTIGTPPFTFTVQYRVQGTPSFTSGPLSSGSPILVPGLASNTTYEFEIITRNSAGTSISNIVTATTLLVPPGPATNLTATQVQATAVTLLWSAPSVGSPPFSYVVQYRVTGTIPFNTLPVGGSIGVTVTGLSPATEYDFEVVTTN